MIVHTLNIIPALAISTKHNRSKVKVMNIYMQINSIHTDLSKITRSYNTNMRTLPKIRIIMTLALGLSGPECPHATSNMVCKVNRLKTMGDKWTKPITSAFTGHFIYALPGNFDRGLAAVMYVLAIFSCNKRTNPVSEYFMENLGYIVMVQYIVYRDYRDKPFHDNYIVTKAISWYKIPIKYMVNSINKELSLIEIFIALLWLKNVLFAQVVTFRLASNATC